MKLQFRYHEDSTFKATIELYHNGALVKSYKVWIDYFDAEIDSLISKGYTYGYTPEEVAEAKEWYENRLNNVITDGDELMDQCTMTEQAYKNGYNAALKELSDKIKAQNVNDFMDSWYESADICYEFNQEVFEAVIDELVAQMIKR